MSELDDDYWEVNRSSPIIELDLGDRKMDLTYFNTTVYSFLGGWAMANHVYVVNPDRQPGGTYLFDCQELMDTLIEQHYPYHSEPFPTDGDVLAFRNWQHQRLERELHDLGNGNTSPSEEEDNT